MSTSKKFSWVHWTIPAVLAFYFFAGLATKRTGEVFPVFHWALFATAKETRASYELYIIEQDGQNFSPPALLQNTEEYKERLAASYDVYNTLGVISSFARAYQAGRTERAEELERVLENNFVPGDDVRYKILRVEYNALERYHTAKVRSTSTVGIFSKETNVAEY